MTAKELVHLAGRNLLGKQIWSGEYGDYPGGAATILEIDPDPGSGIALMVQHPTWKNAECPDGKMGIFDDEEIEATDPE